VHFVVSYYTVTSQCTAQNTQRSYSVFFLYFILCWPWISLQILGNNQLDAFFMYLFIYLFISCLYMFRASQRSSSGDRIVL